MMTSRSPSPSARGHHSGKLQVDGAYQLLPGAWPAPFKKIISGRYQRLRQRRAYSTTSQLYQLAWLWSRRKLRAAFFDFFFLIALGRHTRPVDMRC